MANYEQRSRSRVAAAPARIGSSVMWQRRAELIRETADDHQQQQQQRPKSQGYAYAERDSNGTYGPRTRQAPYTMYTAVNNMPHMQALSADNVRSHRRHTTTHSL